MSKGLIRIHILFTMFLLGSATKAQEYRYQEFSEADGLGNNKISAIEQDWKGNLWIANYGEGLTKYDGQVFRNYNENDGLTNNRVRCLAFDREQRLWVGTLGGGISIMQADEFASPPAALEKIGDNIQVLKLDGKGNMWIGTRSGLYQFKDGEVINISKNTLVPNMQVLCLQEDREGNMWVGFADDGLFKISSGGEGNYKIQRYTTNEGLLHNSVTKLALDKNNNLLIGTIRGIQKLNLEKLESLEELSLGLPNEQVFDIHVHETLGTLVAFGPAGMYMNENKVDGWRKFTEKDSLFCYMIYIDRENNLWLSDWNKGLSQVRPSFITTYDNKLGLPIEEMSHLSYGHEGLLVSTDDGLYKYQDDSFMLYNALDIGTEPMRLTYQSPSQETWLFGQAGLKFKLKNEWQDFRRYRELIPPKITDIAEDARGNVWITSWGYPLLKYDGSSIDIIRNDSAYSEQYFFSALPAADSSMWFGTKQSGMLMIKDEITKVYDAGLKKGQRVSDIVQDGRGTIWALFQGSQIVGFNGAERFRLGTDQGFSEDMLSLLIVGEELWVSSRSGVYCIGLANVYDGNPSFALKFDESDGMPTKECIPKMLVADSNRNIWVGTKAGLIMIDKQITEAYAHPTFPSIHISKIQLGFRDVNWEKMAFDLDPITNLPVDPMLSYNENQPSFFIKGISMTSEELNLYRYKLEGQDDEFSPITSSPILTFHDMAPGEYKLRIKPCDFQGRCSENEVTFSFSIQTPFWRSWWFVFLSLSLIIALLFGVIKLRERNLVADQMKLEKKVHQRTAEIESQKLIIEENNRNITDSIRYAKRIQKAMLVSERGFKRIFAESFILYMPKDIVSGDFYFTGRVNGKKILAVADCTGHGVPGAVMSMLGYSLFAEATQKPNINTADQILNYVSSSIIRLLRQQEEQRESRDGMDASIIVHDAETSELEFAGANNSIYVIGRLVLLAGEPRIIQHHLADDLQLIEIKPDKQPLGINKSGGTEPFTMVKLKASPGTIVYQFSDGYVDQFGGVDIDAQTLKGKKFKSAKLRKLLGEIYHLPMDEQKAKLYEALAKWKGPLEQVDDVTLVGIKLS